MTLVEVLVAMAIGMVILNALQELLFRGSSVLERSHSHVSAASGAQLLIERIHADVRRLANNDPFLLGGGAGPPVSFNVLDEAGGVTQVTYALVDGPSEGTYYVSRNGRVLRAVILKELVIRPEIPVAGSGHPIFGVLTMLVATDQSGSTDFPLVDFTSVDVQTRRSLDPFWIPVGG